MSPLNLIASLCCALAVVFSLQIAAQGKDEFNGLQTGSLYAMKKDVQDKINEQIGHELHASITYLAMASYFGQDSISLKGFKKFFMENSNEEKGHADKFVNYLNSRNGKVTTLKVKDVEFKGSSGLHALKEALRLENDVTKHLMDLHKLALSQPINDVHLVDELESDLLREQVESIRKISGLIARLERMSSAHNDNLAEYFIDQELYGKE